MAIQFLLVTFPEQRAVLADGTGVGFTNHTLMLPGDEYEITLDGGATLPASQDIALGGTSMVKPLVIAFAPAVAAASAARGMPAPAVVGAKTPPTAKAKAARPTTVAGGKAGAKAGTASAPDKARVATVKPRTKVKKNA